MIQAIHRVIQAPRMGTLQRASHSLKPRFGNSSENKRIDAAQVSQDLVTFSERGDYLLLRGIQHMRYADVKEAIDQDANLDMPLLDNDPSSTPLMKLIFSKQDAGRHEIMELLVKAGATTALTTINQATPLMRMAEEGDFIGAIILLQANDIARVLKMKDKSDRFASEIARQNGHEDLSNLIRSCENVSDKGYQEIQRKLADFKLSEGGFLSKVGGIFGRGKKQKPVVDMLAKVKERSRLLLLDPSDFEFYKIDNNNWEQSQRGADTLRKINAQAEQWAEIIEQICDGKPRVKDHLLKLYNTIPTAEDIKKIAFNMAAIDIKDEAIQRGQTDRKIGVPVQTYMEKALSFLTDDSIHKSLMQPQLFNGQQILREAQEGLTELMDQNPDPVIQKTISNIDLEKQRQTAKAELEALRTELRVKMEALAKPSNNHQVAQLHQEVRALQQRVRAAQSRYDGLQHAMAQ